METGKAGYGQWENGFWCYMYYMLTKITGVFRKQEIVWEK